MDQSVGRNEDKGGRPHSGDSELSFRGIIHVVCQANGRAGKLVGARNIAFSSASSKKEKMRCVCFFFSLISHPDSYVATAAQVLLRCSLSDSSHSLDFCLFPSPHFYPLLYFSTFFWPAWRSPNENAVYMYRLRQYWISYGKREGGGESERERKLVSE